MQVRSRYFSLEWHRPRDQRLLLKTEESISRFSPLWASSPPDRERKKKNLLLVIPECTWAYFPRQGAKGRWAAAGGCDGALWKRYRGSETHLSGHVAVQQHVNSVRWCAGKQTGGALVPGLHDSLKRRKSGEVRSTCSGKPRHAMTKCVAHVKLKLLTGRGLVNRVMSTSAECHFPWKASQAAVCVPLILGDRIRSKEWRHTGVDCTSVEVWESMVGVSTIVVDAVCQ